MGPQGCLAVARSWILGWLRSDEEQVKRAHAVFMLEVHFQLAVSSWSPGSHLALCFSDRVVPSCHRWVMWLCLYI